MQGDLPFENIGAEAGEPEQQLLVPYAPDFTPALLGREIGEDQVLGRLLELAASGRVKTDLLTAIVELGLSHIRGERNQRDMASHVVQGMGNYGLITTDGDLTELTPLGAEILGAPPADRDKIFAAHILTHCGGLRFVNEIRRFELRGEIPTMEDLSFLDRHPTSKSLSTMRAWLGRAGICPGARGYSVSQSALAEILGERTHLLFGLSPLELEFLLAARVSAAQSGSDLLTAAQVATLAEQRRSEVRFRRKSLGILLQKLEERGLAKRTGTRKGAGGSKLTFELCLEGIRLSEKGMRGVLKQADVLLTELEPLNRVLPLLHTGTTHEMGQIGEMLGVHACLMLGLNNLVWRKRAPHSEIDLLADRVSGLTYQRWAIQVKNTGGDLSSDRVDREIGAAAGSGVTHLLFVVPRAVLSRPAKAEILHRCRLTPLQIFYLDVEVFSASDVAQAVHRTLAVQSQDLAAIKRREALDREARR